MKNKYYLHSSNSNIKTPIDTDNKKYLIIRKNGILFLLMKVYIIVPEKLKYLIPLKNYFHIYYPIKNNTNLHNLNIQINTDNNKNKVCLTKKDIIEEVKLYLGINKNSTEFDFIIYNQNLSILMNDYQLTKLESIYNNIIYIKIKLNKDNENTKLIQNKNKGNIKRLQFSYPIENNNKYRTIDYLIRKPKENNSQLNLKKLLNDTVNEINPNNNFFSQKHYIPYSRNAISKKRRDIINSIINNNKIDKKTATDDLDNEKKDFIELNDKIIYKYNYVSLVNYKNSLVNLKNINYLAKNIHNLNAKNKNLQSIDYTSLFKDKNNINNNFRLKLFNKHKKLRYKDISLVKNNTEDLYSLNRDSNIYQNRKKFLKNINNNNSVRTNRKALHLSLPNIIKSYMEAYKNNNNQKNENHE